MNFEEQLRSQLHDSPMPPELAPPAGLADTALRGVRRRRRTNTLLAGITALVALAVGVPMTLSPHGGRPGPALEAGTENPAGGPKAIHAYTTDFVEGAASKTFLLDVTTGQYREVPYRAVLSPDLKRVAVDDNGRMGVADRAALLHDGARAIRWIDTPAGNGLAWSPDGTALLVSSIDRSKSRSVSFVAHRYDVGTGKVTHTPINVNILGSSIGWAADSVNYVALLRGKQTNDTVEAGALQEIKPDGTVGRRIEIHGGSVGGADSYSPSRQYVIADGSDIMSARPTPSQVVNIKTGQTVRLLPAVLKPIGWYDEKTVALLVDGSTDNPVVQLTDITSGVVVRKVPLVGLSHLIGMQIASSAGLPQRAATHNF